MNQLSWLLYFADVAGSLNFILSVITIVSFIVVAICLVAVPMSEGHVLDDDNRPKWLHIIRMFAIFWFLSFIVGAIIPSKETVYAIAASEVGEQVITSPTGQKVAKALEAWLDRQIDPPKDEPTS